MGYWTKNYSGPGGDDLVVRGKLVFGPNASVKNFPAMAENQPESTATDVAGLVADFNALLAKFKAAGLMAADETEGG